jgi:hypothetical protein
MNYLKIILIASFGIVLLCACRLAGARERVARSDPFEGKWAITIEPDDDARKAGERNVDDMLTFTGGKVNTEWGKKHGYPAPEYEEDSRRFGPTKFTAESSNKEGDKAKWSGTVTGGSISGDIIVVKKDGSELRYAYKGEIKH